MICKYLFPQNSKTDVFRKCSISKLARHQRRRRRRRHLLFLVFFFSLAGSLHRKKSSTEITFPPNSFQSTNANKNCFPPAATNLHLRDEEMSRFSTNTNTANKQAGNREVRPLNAKYWKGQPRRQSSGSTPKSLCFDLLSEVGFDNLVSVTTRF